MPINNTYKPNPALFSPKTPFKSLSGNSNGLVSLPTSSMVAKPTGSVTGKAPTVPPVKPQAPATTAPQPQKKAPAVENINGGQAYANPLDNPNFKPAVQSQTSQPTPQPQATATAPATTPPVRGLLGEYLSRGQEQLAEAAKVGGEAGLLRARIQKETQDVMGNRNYSGSVRIGQSGLIQQNLGTQLQGLTAQQQALQGTGQSYLSAAGLAAPVQVSYSNQFLDPTTGQPISGASNANLQTAVASVVEKVKNGQMSYNDAVSALSGYGQGGVNALQQALPANFNVAQSNTLAGQQGSVGVNYQLAETALKNVEDILKDLNPAQTTNIPLINKGANWISTQFGLGSEQTRAMTGAVQSLRNAYASLLASVKGGTPTDYSSQAAAEIPNEPTPNDIAAIRHNFEVLGKARLDVLSNPGQAGTSSNSGGSGSTFAEQW